MNINNKKIISTLTPFCLSALVFIISGIILNTVETFIFCKYQDSVPFLTIFQSYVNIITVFSLYALIILPLYLLIGLLKQKPAQIVISILFSILISLEIGLFIYTKQAGVLMGTELIIRPFHEVWMTIRNSSNITIDIVSIIAVCAFFIALPFVLKKTKLLNSSLFLLVSFIIIGVLSVCTLFYQRDRNQTINNYIESKSYYFFSSIVNYITEEPEMEYFVIDEDGDRIEKNETILKKYISLFNNKSLADLEYPMERPVSEFPDVLSPYFRKSERQPNIVIIIVESLGNYFLGDKGNHISFTPFLDSLAHVGLYWKNCLSTTSRTYGVLPAVIGSVPHGIRGFQFGVMPQHHSLFSILKSDYLTNFYYGGNLNFDNMLDFIAAQEPDHIDNFLPQMKSFKRKKRACWWGLYDHVLFEESVNYLKTLSKEKPKVNVYLTLTTHDPLNKENTTFGEYYDNKANKIFSKLNATQKDYFLPVKDRLSGILYIDDCIRNFIKDYSKQIDAENTIFVITGDHSVGIFKNDLSYYSVPLIIWSPLLTEHRSFPNIVSHISITPSIISFLQHSYNLKVPKKLAWCSIGLDTSSVFNPSEKILFLSYDRIVNEMVYNQYFFEDKTKWNDRKLYEIKENLDVQEVNDDLLMKNIYSKFNTLKYVNNYVYHNNKLIKTDEHADTDYKLIKTYKNDNTIVCKTPDTIPSIVGIDLFDILPAQKIKEQYSKIKIKLMTDIIINDFVYQDEQMKLNFVVSGKKFDYTFSDHITKYIVADDILCNKTYKLLVEKEMDVNNSENIATHIYVSTNEYDANWKPDKKITISNIRVLIYGEK